MCICEIVNAAHWAVNRYRRSRGCGIAGTRAAQPTQWRFPSACSSLDDRFWEPDEIVVGRICDRLGQFVDTVGIPEQEAASTEPGSKAAGGFAPGLLSSLQVSKHSLFVVARPYQWVARDFELHQLLVGRQFMARLSGGMFRGEANEATGDWFIDRWFRAFPTDACILLYGLD